jgi:hypothetical protein
MMVKEELAHKEQTIDNRATIDLESFVEKLKLEIDLYLLSHHSQDK